MRKAIAPLVLTLTGVGLAGADTISEKAQAERRARLQKLERPYEVHPRRRDYPLRYENITDNEVREIQSAARDVVPRALINISGVAVGCPCEDGAACTDQVWIVAHRPDKSVELLLSKIDGHWVIGPVQRWWLRYENLRSRVREYKSYSAYLHAEEKLADAFPKCEGAGDDA